MFVVVGGNLGSKKTPLGVAGWAGGELGIVRPDLLNWIATKKKKKHNPWARPTGGDHRPGGGGKKKPGPKGGANHFFEGPGLLLFSVRGGGTNGVILSIEMSPPHHFYD